MWSACSLEHVDKTNEQTTPTRRLLSTSQVLCASRAGWVGVINTSWLSAEVGNYLGLTQQSTFLSFLPCIPGGKESPGLPLRLSLLPLDPRIQDCKPSTQDLEGRFAV